MIDQVLNKVQKLSLIITLVASPGIEPGFQVPETYALSIVLRGQIKLNTSLKKRIPSLARGKPCKLSTKKTEGFVSDQKRFCHNFVVLYFCGDTGIRTPDPLHAMQVRQPAAPYPQSSLQVQSYNLIIDSQSFKRV